MMGYTPAHGEMIQKTFCIYVHVGEKINSLSPFQHANPFQQANLNQTRYKSSLGEENIFKGIHAVTNYFYVWILIKVTYIYIDEIQTSTKRS
jgi:hypothetical protein